MPPSAPRERFALLIRMHVGHSLNLLSNGGCWLNTLSIWGNTIEGHARLQPTLSGGNGNARPKVTLNCALCHIQAGDRRAEQSPCDWEMNS